MKKEEKPTKPTTDKSKHGHENQNIHDFDKSQYTSESDVEKIKKEKEAGKKEKKEEKKK